MNSLSELTGLRLRFARCSYVHTPHFLRFVGSSLSVCVRWYREKVRVSWALRSFGVLGFLSAGILARCLGEDRASRRTGRVTTRGASCLGVVLRCAAPAIILWVISRLDARAIRFMRAALRLSGNTMRTGWFFFQNGQRISWDWVRSGRRIRRSVRRRLMRRVSIRE